MKHRKRNFFLAAGLFFLVSPPALFWLGGWNFDTRGETAVLCATATFLSVAIGLAFANIFWLETYNE